MIEKNLIRVEFTLTKWNSLLQLSFALDEKVISADQQPGKPSSALEYGEHAGYSRFAEHAECGRFAEHADCGNLQSMRSWKLYIF